MAVLRLHIIFTKLLYVFIIMDDDNTEHTRKIYSRRQKRWSLNSMSSQRLEEIIAKLMQPISDLKQNFDTDLCLLLEEYLTEAGLHQLEQEEDDSFQPNFAEIALLLQQSATIYSKKVDFLYQNVLDMIDTFNSQNVQNEERVREEQVQKTRLKRKRKHSETLKDFQPIELEVVTNITMKDSEFSKPPPCLPKTYIEFEPRIITDKDAKLYDYKGEVIGLVNDFHVNWNMNENGMLCDDLDLNAAISKDMLHPLTVTTLNDIGQSVITPPESGNNSDCGTECRTPSQLELPMTNLTQNNINDDMNDSGIQEADEDIVTAKSELKRKTPEQLGNFYGISRIKGQTNLTGRYKKLKLEMCCFDLPVDMIEKVIERRKNKIKKLKRKFGCIDTACLEDEYLLDSFLVKMKNETAERYHRWQLLRGFKMLATAWEKDFLAFESPHPNDIGGFKGFTNQEIAETKSNNSNKSQTYKRILKKYDEDSGIPSKDTSAYTDTDDDGFFSSESVFSQTSQEEPSTEVELDCTHLPCSLDQSEITKRVEAWHSMIHPRLELAEKRSQFDVHNYGRDILKQFNQTNGASSSTKIVQFSQVIKMQPQDDVARYFLATLMLANTGNIEIVKKSELGDFDLKVKSLDHTRYRSINPFE